MNINLTGDYGPLKTNLSFVLKDGYNVFVGANNSGKSALIQFIFKWLVREVPEYGLEKVALILPDRLYIDPTTQSGERELRVHNDELASQMVEAPLSYHGFVGPPRGELFKLLISHNDLESQSGLLRTYLEKIDLPKHSISGSRQNIIFNQISAGLQGSGLRSVLPILAALTHPGIEVILIDEPELSLEPKVQRLLRDLFYEVSQNKRIIVATQSNLFLNRKNFVANFKVRKENGTVLVEEISSESELYDLTFALLGNSLSDLFFPENFIIVEGPSDQVIVEKALELKGIGKFKVKVISASGVDNLNNTKEAILNALKPLVINDSPYKSKVVVMTDQRNQETASKVQEIQDELTDRFFELTLPSLEEYLPAELYTKAQRVRDDDIVSLERVKNDYAEQKKLKKEISDQIAAVMELTDLDSISIIKDSVEKASA